MEPTTVIRNLGWAVVWDGARHAYRQDVDVFLHGDAVAAIAPHDPAVPPPAGVTVVEGSGLMAMPGW